VGRPELVIVSKAESAEAIEVIEKLAFISRSQIKLHADHAVNGLDVLFAEGAQPPQQAPFAGCRELIRHGLATGSIKRDISFRRIQALDLA
jgi:hypothetical protein